MYKKPTKKQIEAFRKAALALLNEVGTCDETRMYPHQVLTRAGILSVGVHDDWLACRFEDIELAKHVLGVDSNLNPHSGKWNWHGLDVLPYFEMRVRALIAPAHVRVECEELA